MLQKKIVFFKKLNSVGGPSSFQKKFIFWLKKNHIKYEFLSFKNLIQNKILIINAGTFNFPLLFLSIFYKTKLVQRLDGFYNISIQDGFIKKLRCYCINISMQFIRKYLANYIIYQSLNSKKQWDNCYKKVKTNYSIIHNPSFANLDNMRNKKTSRKFFDIVIVEGSIENNYYNQKLLNLIYDASKKNKKINKIYIFGNIDESLKKKLLSLDNFIIKNAVTHETLIKFYKKNNIIFFGIEFNACCSNSIIEASSFGIPSITLNTGSYKELIQNSGIQINFKNINDNKLEKNISNSLLKIINHYRKYSKLTIENSSKFKPNSVFDRYIRSIRNL